VLSLAHVIRNNDHGLIYWLGLPEWDSKNEQGHETCATNVANMIMKRRDMTNRGSLYLNDVTAVPGLKSSDAKNLFHLFDSNVHGYATVEDIRNAIGVILQEKRYVVDMCTSRSLIIGIFHQMIRALVVTFILMIILVILLEVDVYTLLVGLGTVFVGLGFALSTTIQGLLESLQMIFFVRPFEIGDIVKINDSPPLQVEKVGVVSTFFFTMDGYGIFYSNAELARSRISNWKRSKDVSFDIPVYLSMETTAEHLSTLKHRIQAYLDSNPQHSPKQVMYVSEFQKTCMTVIFKITLKASWQDRPLWLRYTSDLRVFTIAQVMELGVQYQRSELFKNVPWEPHTVV